jgi:hypothetical protein
MGNHFYYFDITFQMFYDTTSPGVSIKPGDYMVSNIIDNPM